MIFSGKFTRKNVYQVFKDGEIFSPDRSLAIRNHSPTGFSWGYNGSGCAQLALAILLEVTDRVTAEQLYQDYKRSVTSMLPDTWKLDSEDVREWLKTARTTDVDEVS